VLQEHRGPSPLAFCDAGLRQVIGPPPNQRPAVDPPPIFRRVSASGARIVDLPAPTALCRVVPLPGQLDHPQLYAAAPPALRSHRRPARQQRRLGTDRAPGAVHRAAQAGPISFVSRFTSKMVVREPRLALGVRRHGPKSARRLSFLAHAPRCESGRDCIDVPRPPVPAAISRRASRLGRPHPPRRLLVQKRERPQRRAAGAPPDRAALALEAGMLPDKRRTSAARPRSRRLRPPSPCGSPWLRPSW
jgi:hypothetical protein